MFNTLFKRKYTDLLYLKERARALTEYTPDRAVLEGFQFQLLFVYDETQRGHYEAEKLGNEWVWGATAYTANRYALWKKKLGLRTQAIALSPSIHDTFHGWANQKGAPAARIQGELLVVTPNTIFGLDKYKENMVVFRRIRVHLIVPYREEIWLKEKNAVEHLTGTTFPRSLYYSEEKVVEVKAWMYVGMQEYWSDLLDGGYLFAPVKIYAPKKKELGIYSQFTKLEYEF